MAKTECVMIMRYICRNFEKRNVLVREYVTIFVVIYSTSTVVIKSFVFVPIAFNKLGIVILQLGSFSLTPGKRYIIYSYENHSNYQEV